jgi:hypothetical protein
VQGMRRTGPWEKDKTRVCMIPVRPARVKGFSLQKEGIGKNYPVHASPMSDRRAGSVKRARKLRAPAATIFSVAEPFDPIHHRIR